MAVFTVIDHTELGAAASSYDVTSIPASYDHLYLEYSARSDRAAAYRDFPDITLNADTGTNYSATYLFTSRSTPSSYRYTGQASIKDLEMTAASSTADTFGVGTVWIPNYANTANFKQILARSAAEGATTTDYQWGLNCVAGLWSDTSAVDQITLTPQSGDNFVQYSTFTLYGVTGA